MCDVCAVGMGWDRLMKLFESVDPEVSEAGDEGGGIPAEPAVVEAESAGNGTPLPPPLICEG